MAVKRLFKTGKKGVRVSKSGILFKQVRGVKSAPVGVSLIVLEKKHGAKNVEVIKKGKRTLFFRRVR